MKTRTEILKLLKTVTEVQEYLLWSDFNVYIGKITKEEHEKVRNRLLNDLCAVKVHLTMEEIDIRSEEEVRGRRGEKYPF